MLFYFVLSADLVFVCLSMVFIFESCREQEFRAAIIAGAGVTVGALIILMSYSYPTSLNFFGILFLLATVFGLALCIPGRKNHSALRGAMGYAVKQVTRFNEADSVFARARLKPENTKVYKEYYRNRKEQEKRDKLRRTKGVLGVPGAIDGCHALNNAMLFATDEVPNMLRKYAISHPGNKEKQIDLSEAKAARIVKNFTQYLGANLVGICRLNPNWVYSHRGEIHDGNWENWGKEIDDLPPFAVVIVVEMERDLVVSAPHTPTAIESTTQYAKGTYISTILARWFFHMGYKGVAEHSRNYDIILPPVAVDAGLGEIGRQGYLIAPKYGARVRLFAVLTDMPLKVDKPISLGVEAFCRKCKKCADACPSRSIPRGEMTECRGVKKWKLDEESCYDYWSRVGTDCAVCMAICPFSRPDSLFHRTIRFLVAYSLVAKVLFPHFDNFIYGKKWKTRKVPDWLRYPKRVIKN